MFTRHVPNSFWDVEKNWDVSSRQSGFPNCNVVDNRNGRAIGDNVVDDVTIAFNAVLFSLKESTLAFNAEMLNKISPPVVSST